MPEFPEEDNDSWYYWRNMNWGTKWEPKCECDEYGFDNFYTECLHYHEGSIYFDTAWRPPIQWLTTVSEKYPDLLFELRYSECGMNFSGYIRIEDKWIYCGDEGNCGEYYGERECQFCDGYIQWDEGRRYNNNSCECCETKSFDTIGKFVRKKKIENLPKKLACMRIGRNAILDNYLMRKVFVFRLNECVI
jgi:hypothetical protein